MKMVEIKLTWHCSLIKKMMRSSIESRRRKYVKRYGFLSYMRNLWNKYGKKLLNTATKTGLDTLKTEPKKGNQ